MEQSKRPGVNRKLKRLVFHLLFPLVFLTAVLLFMVVFRHEEEMTNAEKRAIESVTFEEEWARYGHLPVHLVEATEGLPSPLKSRIIHRMMDEIPLHVMQLPSEELAAETHGAFAGFTAGNEKDEPVFFTTVNDETAMRDLPGWLVHFSNRFNEVYNTRDMLDITFLPPNEASRVIMETIEEEKEKRLEEEELEQAEGKPGVYSGFGEEEDEPIPVYRKIAKDIRAQSPDVVLLDFDLIAEHLEHDEVKIAEGGMTGVEETVDQTYEFLEALYRSIDTFTTYILFSDEVFEHLGLSPTEQLEDQLNLLADQNEYVHVVRIPSYNKEDEQEWAENHILPLFYRR
ncbi:hypothetical protein K8O68_08310 [Salipaludibacillus sp. CUR1]|uniref:hypothetical protein n=1 Tax=Salipaludibacillus sp. CUR1 TaxID=2820003 RepID=UPI001E45F534|nr:hypothetical protein [Salipaludibacillus sp. CUR1]MCE7792417.1 hypothetical protein [Salipaludibacillus sp. CUR1]